jgi:hypothetical protein
MTKILACIVVSSPVCIKEVIGSILDLETSYLDSEFLWHSLILPDECWHKTLKLAMIVSVSALSNSLLRVVFGFNIYSVWLRKHKNLSITYL